MVVSEVVFPILFRVDLPRIQSQVVRFRLRTVLLYTYAHQLLYTTEDFSTISQRESGMPRPVLYCL